MPNNILSISVQVIDSVPPDSGSVDDQLQTSTIASKKKVYLFLFLIINHVCLLIIINHLCSCIFYLFRFHS
jgi:hypothetical protein